LKTITTVASILIAVLLSSCATTTTTHVNDGYDRPIERLLVIVGFQSIHGPFGHPNPGTSVPTRFLPDFETALTERWQREDLAVLVDAVTVDGQVDLVSLLSEADPNAVLLVEQTAEEDEALYKATLIDTPTGDRIWEGEYTGSDVEPDAVAKRMYSRVNQGIRRSNLAVF
jgi:hypothetical protein